MYGLQRKFVFIIHFLRGKNTSNIHNAFFHVSPKRQILHYLGLSLLSSLILALERNLPKIFKKKKPEQFHPILVYSSLILIILGLRAHSYP